MLRRKLEQRGYAVAETPLDVFQRSGGSACCLTLRLDHASTIGVSQPEDRRHRSANAAEAASAGLLPGGIL
jgi:hypothetical protein